MSQARKVLKVQASAGLFGIQGRFVDMAVQAMEEGAKGTKLTALDERVIGSAKLHVARVFERECNRSWVNGFGLALAEVNRRFGQEATIVEVARAAGFVGKVGLKSFKDAGLEEYDLRELRKCLK